MMEILLEARMTICDWFNSDSKGRTLLILVLMTLDGYCHIQSHGDLSTKPQRRVNIYFLCNNLEGTLIVLL